MSGNRTANATAPASRAVANPTQNALVEATRGVYVGGSGNLVVIMADDKAGAAGTKVTFTNLAAGICHPLQVIWFDSTTTATGVIALY